MTRPTPPPPQPTGPTHPTPTGPGRTVIEGVHGPELQTFVQSGYVRTLNYPGDPTGAPPEPAPRPGTPVPPLWFALAYVGSVLMILSGGVGILVAQAVQR